VRDYRAQSEVADDGTFNELFFVFLGTVTAKRELGLRVSRCKGGEEERRGRGSCGIRNR
jgi:hypothetical protein